jgi:hypothetical protein
VARGAACGTLPGRDAAGTRPPSRRNQRPPFRIIEAVQGDSAHGI